MTTNTNNQGNSSCEIPSHNLRSINIQDLWAHDQRHVSNTGRRGPVHCSSPLGPGRGNPATPTSSIEGCTEGANEVKVVIEGTTQSVTGAQVTGDFGHNSFLAVYRGLDWNDSLAMLNWRLQEAYAERGESSTNSTDTTFSSTDGSADMATDVSEGIAEEEVEKKAISPLELEPCYSIPSSDSPNDTDGDSDGINSQQSKLSVSLLESPASESASSAPHPGNNYHGLGWTERLEVLNQNLREAYERSGTGDLNTPMNTTRPQINFCAEDEPIPPCSYPPGPSIPQVSPPPNSIPQESSPGYQQQVYPTYEPNWGPYPYFSEQKPQVPHHLFCPSAAHAISCGGIFVDPRAVAAIDHVVYNSAMMMFENFRRQYLAMEGKSNVGWWPVHGSGLDARGTTHAHAGAVNVPGAPGDSSGEGRANRGMRRESREEMDEETNKGAKVRVQDTTATGIDAQPTIPRLSMQGSSTQVDTELVQDRLNVTETLTASSQTEAIEIASTRSFGVQTDDLEVVGTDKTINSSAHTTSTKISSVGTSTDAENLPVQTHSAPEAHPQPPANKKHKYKKRKNKARANTSNAAPPLPPPSPPPPPAPPSPAIPCEHPSTLEQTITPITMDKIKKSPEPFVQWIPIPTVTGEDGEPVTAPFELKAQESTTNPNWFKAMMFCSFLFLALDFAFSPEGDP